MRSFLVNLHELRIKMFFFIYKQNQSRLNTTEYYIYFFIGKFKHGLYHQWPYEILESLKFGCTLIDHLICLKFSKEDYSWIVTLKCLCAVLILCMEEFDLLFLISKWFMSGFEKIIIF